VTPQLVALALVLTTAHPTVAAARAPEPDSVTLLTEARIVKHTLADGAQENHLTQHDVSLQPELLGFTGKEADSEVGLVYFGERYLIPRLARWATPDPLHIHALGGGEALNSYHYVAGNLLQARDPVGLDVEAKGTTVSNPERPRARLRVSDTEAAQMFFRDFLAGFEPREHAYFRMSGTRLELTQPGREAFANGAMSETATAWAGMVENHEQLTVVHTVPVFQGTRAASWIVDRVTSLRPGPTLTATSEEGGGQAFPLGLREPLVGEVSQRGQAHPSAELRRQAFQRCDARTGCNVPTAVRDDPRVSADPRRSEVFYSSARDPAAGMYTSFQERRLFLTLPGLQMTMSRTLHHEAAGHVGQAGLTEPYWHGYSELDQAIERIERAVEAATRP